MGSWLFPNSMSKGMKFPLHHRTFLSKKFTFDCSCPEILARRVGCTRAAKGKHIFLYPYQHLLCFLLDASASSVSKLCLQTCLLQFLILLGQAWLLYICSQANWVLWSIFKYLQCRNCSALLAGRCSLNLFPHLGALRCTLFADRAYSHSW